MEGADRKFRPEVVISTNRSPNDEYWLVDGTLRLKSRSVGKNTPVESRELRDSSARLKQMDELAPSPAGEPLTVTISYLLSQTSRKLY